MRINSDELKQNSKMETSCRFPNVVCQQQTTHFALYIYNIYNMPQQHYYLLKEIKKIVISFNSQSPVYVF